MAGSLHEALSGGSVLTATKAAVEAADHLTVMDAGAVAVLCRLAEAIDNIDEDGLNPAGKLDNVSAPTYLKFATALGLSVEGRRAPAKPSEEVPRGKLGDLRQQVQGLKAV